MTTPPPITGYRQLSELEVAQINRIKEAGIARTDLQTGLMALARAVAQPTTF